MFRKEPEQEKVNNKARGSKNLSKIPYIRKEGGR